MAATTQSVASFGRIAVGADPSFIQVTVVASATTYTSASGGLPIDLTIPLTQAAPFSMAYINPADVVGLSVEGVSSTGKYMPAALVIGTPIYTNPATYPFAGGSSTNVRPDLQLATCPATIRLYNGTTEFADGACSETVTFYLVYARGGQNVN
jgi:hypothetical protein